MNELFNALQNSALAALIGKQNHLFGAAAQLLHIGGLILVLAPVLLISLRLFFSTGAETRPVGSSRCGLYRLWLISFPLYGGRNPYSSHTCRKQAKALTILNRESRNIGR